MAPTLALRIAVVLLLVMGLSGASVGISLGWATATSGLQVTTTAVAIVGGLLAYGLALLASGIGLLLGRGWAWALGVATIGLGLAILLWVLWLSDGRDAVTAGGIAIWAVTLALLVIGAPARARRSGSG
jgi:hypothetical protein